MIVGGYICESLRSLGGYKLEILVIVGGCKHELNALIVGEYKYDCLNCWSQ